MRQAARSENTQAALVAAARELFAEHGYAAVGTAEIIDRAGSSRGAMYHHFADKQALFRAVYEQVQQDLIGRILVAMDGIDDPAETLVAGLRAFLDACLEPEKARIGLLDAPAVLGWRAWRELDERYALGAVVVALDAGVASGDLRPDLPVRPLAHMVLAALGEAGLMIVGADDPPTARREAEQALLGLLDGARVSRGARTSPTSPPA